MPVQPISNQLANYNVEQLAQTSKQSIAQAQQTGMMDEMLKKIEKRAQEVQPSDEIVASEKVHRKTDDEQREDNRRKQEDEEKSKKKMSDAQDGQKEEKPLWGTPIKKDGRYDFYV